MITDENKSHYVHVKGLADLCLVKQKIRIKNIFSNIVYNVLVVKEFWWNIKKFVWYGLIKIKNSFKQLAATFKHCANF